MLNKIILLSLIFLFNGCTVENLKRNFTLKQNSLHSNNNQIVGKVVSLESDIFSKDNVNKGFWRPFNSLNTSEYGLFLLEEYNPSKKLVLFIHGISGTPTQFSYLIDNLDKTKFQSLIAFYPSGLPLAKLSKYLNNSLNILQSTLNFKSISLVAHSMGGLVSRDIINIQTNSEKLIVDKFISISTPWDGHEAAKYGVKYTPVIIPVWKDMVPNSMFLKRLFKTPLSKDIKHYLFFGFKGISITAGGNSDGTVSIKGQLKIDVQNDATLVKGYNENHTSILKNRDLSNSVNEMLVKTYSK